MREHGAEATIDVQVTDQLTDLAFELGQRLFRDRAEDSYSAVYAASDSTAVGLLQAAHQSGLEVPRDLSVVGFDDIDMARYTIPPLTTIRQGGVEMGRAAVDLLIRMVENEVDRDELEDVVFEPTLIVRESTAPPHKEE